MFTHAADRSERHIQRTRNGHALVEALIAMTVLLIGSTMVAHTMLAVVRQHDARTRRTAAFDALDHRITGHWSLHCAGWSAPLPVGTPTGATPLSIKEESHPTLSMAGLRLRARWSDRVSSEGGAHEFTTSSGHWCGR